jgi:hypothetical protein
MRLHLTPLARGGVVGLDRVALVPVLVLRYRALTLLEGADAIINAHLLAQVLD